jgi:ABC-2 family transporter protein
MLARLWWKEYRVFGPVWLILALASGLLQWLYLSTDDPAWRTGSLTTAALSWSVLYAFACGAAMFAGERESKTLGFLDALPVARGTLWLGKASFALASTFALALLLAGIAALGTESREIQYRYGAIARLFVPVLFEAVAWSLLWSSLSKNPLLAGAMGVLSVYASMILTDIFTFDQLAPGGTFMESFQVVPSFVAAVAALAISGSVMAWRAPGRSSSRRLRAIPEPAPRPIRASSVGRSLIWQAGREGWTTWLLVGLMGLGLPSASWLFSQPGQGVIVVFFPILACLVAGVSVFGMENASGARRFLVQHGVAAGTAWSLKFLTWGIALGSIFGVSWAFSWSHWALAGNVETLQMQILLTLLNAFTLGLLCGMAIPRRITAALVGVIILIAALPIQLGLVANEMVPNWSIFLLPLIFLTASRAWAGDWLLEREGARPWLRLGAWLAVPSLLLGASYVSYRAYSIPDIGPQFVGANLQGPTIAPEQDAAEAYRRAVALIKPEPDLFQVVGRTASLRIEEVIQQGWDLRETSVKPTTEVGQIVHVGPIEPKVLKYWKENQSAIEQARKASALPVGRFQDVGRLTRASEWEPIFQDLELIGQLLGLDTRERLSRKDLPGAWDDILAQFRMANQLGTNRPTETQMALAIATHHQAIGLAFEWLGTAGQSPESLRRALVDLKALPTPPNLAMMIQVEASIIERTLNLSGNQLAAEVYLYRGQKSAHLSTLEHLWFARIMAAPWERQRARRVIRRLIAGELSNTVLEPYQRGSTFEVRLASAPEISKPWDLTRGVMPDLQGVGDRLDRELVGRRALDQAVAIEAWKLGHDGGYPETLQALISLPQPRIEITSPGYAFAPNPPVVPGLLEQLPLDPYSGKPFGYVRSQGQPIRPPILPDGEPRFWLPTKEGQRLLYSIGPDRRDEGSRVYGRTISGIMGDLTYPIP